MMSSNARSQVLTKEIGAVHFTFYSDEEVRTTSVKSITSPILFDNLNRPAPEGLYDAALGPIDNHTSCVTCGESFLNCPGHCGHIELAMTVYNPLVFRHLLKFMNQMCTHCHHFKLTAEKLNDYADKLDEIRKNNSVDSKFRSSSNEEQYSWTSFQLSEAREILSSMISELKLQKNKCANCGLNTPKVTSPVFGRLHMSELSKKEVNANILKGLKSHRGTRRKDHSSEISANQTMGDNVTDLSEGEENESAEKESLNGADMTVKNLMEKTESKFVKDRLLTPIEIKDHLRLLWENETRICCLMWDIQQEKKNSWKQSPSYEMFFLQVLLVPPSRFRPPNKVGTSVLEHPQNILYSKVLQANIAVVEALKSGKNQGYVFQVTNRWLNLQDAVNVVIDSNTANTMKGKDVTGVRQLLEKKEGLFRQNMMGKRVNYACRSVISPDPYLAVNEIGIPPYFALRLTYPEKVTPWNEEKLRQAIRNGPHVYPGATHFEDEQGMVDLSKILPHQRNSIAKKLLSTRGVASSGTSVENIDSNKVEGKVVYRHLQDGDVLLVNRQPTLHKPSMMAHIARVLKGEKTLRMHYANCSAYNADFDGDEMNVHFPQDEISRAEAYSIVNANKQYTVPTSGDPIRGLIQDHIVSATLLTKRDTFLSKEEYQNLVYSACISSFSGTSHGSNSQPKVAICKEDSLFVSLPPAVWKPVPLWTGKQVITTILDYITRGSLPFSMKKLGRVPAIYWGRESWELEVVIQNNELVCGVIDKAQFGKYGLVHVVHELYGADAAGRLLSVFSRLFTFFMQMHGFTCGAVDLLLFPRAEIERREKLAKAKEEGDKAHAQFLGKDAKEIDLGKIEEEIEKILRSKGESSSARLDRLMSGALNKITSEVNGSVFPDGLRKPFLKNCLSLMTLTGAKGGMVNFTQISSLLGQQELEGKRVPRMISGKTLPCFSPWDTQPRAGGFISDRFLTGLRPQEYYFHCMAGRDGLVDTAVKTSRSGYLQRCLIKNLECLTVFYDHTVRDSDGSVIQFCYGEDGVDVTKSSCLTGFEILAANQKLLSQKLCKEKFNDFTDRKLARKSSSACVCDATDIPEKLKEKAHKYIYKLSEKEKHLWKLRKPKKFLDLLRVKYISSLAEPGEAVGVVAGQSVGEPSTQMTLNTFHFAGRGEMNVTLGIPRLREILMAASKNILTPVMTCRMKDGNTREDAERLAGKFRRIRFSDLIETMDVGVVPFAVKAGVMQNTYKLKIKLYSPENYPPHSGLSLEKCKSIFEEVFSKEMERELKKALKKSRKKAEGAVQVFSESQPIDESGMSSDDEVQANSGQKKPDNGTEQDDAYEDEQDDSSEDEGADGYKRKVQGTDEMDYDDEIDEDEKSMAEYFSTEANTDDDSGDDVNSDMQNTLAEEDSLVDEMSSRSMVTDLGKSLHKKRKKKNDSTVSVTSGRTLTWEYSVMENSHILLAPIAEKVANKVYVQSVTNIDKCAVIEIKEKKDDPPIPALQTNGINFEAFWKLDNELDINRLMTNDINKVLEVYGVEAACATIVLEVQNVFASYGITVDRRHLSLIADFMTFNGGYRPLNRIGIDSSTSPFLKISFETATKFLVDSCLQGETDYLASPSARIVLGQVAKMGTGCFDILQNLEVS